MRSIIKLFPWTRERCLRSSGQGTLARYVKEAEELDEKLSGLD